MMKESAMRIKLKAVIAVEVEGFLKIIIMVVVSRPVRGELVNY